MNLQRKVNEKPSWDRLYQTAAAQEGHFTTAQAAEAGYYPALLAKYLRSGRIVRVRHGIYRIVHFPAGDREDLVVVWLWTGRVGVFSHETALALHGLSDVLPARIHVSVPASWGSRRLRVPEGVDLHFEDVASSEATWVGAVRVTAVARTLEDCARAALPPDLVGQALQEASERGLLDRDSVHGVTDYLNGFAADGGRKGHVPNRGPEREEERSR